MILLRIVLLLVALVQSAHAAIATDFYVHLQAKRQAALIVWQDISGRPGLAVWVADGTGAVQWRNPDGSISQAGTEHMAIRNGWIMLDRFGPWSADCIKAELVDIQTGTVMEFPCKPGGGHPYVPMILPRDPFRVRVWGLIDGKQAFYWETDFAHVGQVRNECWYEGPQSRESIQQSEAWFAAHGGWLIGSGGAPFDAQGKPQAANAVHGCTVTVAKGAGVWTYAVGKDRACLYSLWNW